MEEEEEVISMAVREPPAASPKLGHYRAIFEAAESSWQRCQLELCESCWDVNDCATHLEVICEAFPT